MDEAVSQSPPDITTATDANDYPFDMDNYNKAMVIFYTMDTFNFYAKPILFFVCFVGNILSLVILGSKELKDFPQKYLLAAIALLDIMVGLLFLRSYLSVHVLKAGAPLDFLVRDVSPFVCKFTLYLFYLTSHLSAWSIVLLTVERFCVTWFPLRFHEILSSKRIIVIWCLMAVAFILIEIPLFFYIEYKPEADYDFTCHFESQRVSGIWDTLDLVLMCVGPFSIIATLDLLIVVKLHQNRKKMKSLTDYNPKAADAKLKALTTMMFLICVAFMLTTTPAAIYNFGAKSWFRSTDTLSAANDYRIFTILDNLYLINHSINFFFYFASGPKFRLAFVNLFCRCSKRDTSSSTPTHSNPTTDSTRVRVTFLKS